MKALLRCALLLLPWQFAQADSLLDLYQLAIESDPRLKASQAQVEVGEARLDQATSGLLPQVNVIANWSENQREQLALNSDDHFKGEKYNLIIQQDLLNLDKWHNRKRHQYLSRERQSQLQGRILEVSADLVERYLLALAKQDALTLIAAERRATQKQLEQLKKRFEKQLAKITDVLEVEARLDGTLADEISAQAELEVALESLAELVGRPVTGPLQGLSEASISAELGTLDDWLALARHNSPALAGLLARQQAAESGLRQAKAVDMPTLNLTLGAQRSDIGFENAQAPLTETYYASVNLTVPIYLGGKGSALKAENRALVNVAQQEYEETLRKTRRMVREAYLNARASGLRIRASKKAVESAQKSYAAQQRGFQFGAVTVVDVLDALREESRFRRDFRQAQYDFVNNWTVLLSLVGTLDQAHIERLNDWQLHAAAEPAQ